MAEMTTSLVHTRMWPVSTVSRAAPRRIPRHHESYLGLGGIVPVISSMTGQKSNSKRMNLQEQDQAGASSHYHSCKRGARRGMLGPPIKSYIGSGRVKKVQRLNGDTDISGI